MDLLKLIQRDIDEIAEWGHCNFAETFKTLILAKKEIEELRSKVNNSVLDDVIYCGCDNPKIDTMDYENFNCLNCNREIKQT